MKFDDILRKTGFAYVTKDKPEPAPVKEEQPIAKPLGPKEVFMKWIAPSRTNYSQISTKGKKTLIVLGVVVCALLALMQEYFLILAIAAVIYMMYALGKMAPAEVEIEVSNHGIKYGETLYLWTDLSRYFFKKEGEHEVLSVDTYQRLPARIFLFINESDKQKLDDYFAQRLEKLEKEPITIIDKIYTKAASRFDFEKKR